MTKKEREYLFNDNKARARREVIRARNATNTTYQKEYINRAKFYFNRAKLFQ